MNKISQLLNEAEANIKQAEDDGHVYNGKKIDFLLNGKYDGSTNSFKNCTYAKNWYVKTYNIKDPNTVKAVFDHSR